MPGPTYRSGKGRPTGARIDHRGTGRKANGDLRGTKPAPKKRNWFTAPPTRSTRVDKKLFRPAPKRASKPARKRSLGGSGVNAPLFNPKFAKPIMLDYARKEQAFQRKKVIKALTVKPTRIPKYVRAPKIAPADQQIVKSGSKVRVVGKTRLAAPRMLDPLSKGAKREFAKNERAVVKRREAVVGKDLKVLLGGSKSVKTVDRSVQRLRDYGVLSGKSRSRLARSLAAEKDRQRRVAVERKRLAGTSRGQTSLERAVSKGAKTAIKFVTADPNALPGVEQARKSGQPVKVAGFDLRQVDKALNNSRNSTAAAALIAVEQLTRISSAEGEGLSRAIRAAKSGKGSVPGAYLKGLVRGAVDNKSGYAKPLQDVGVSRGAAAGVGFVADILLDPTTYVSFGAVGAAKAAVRTAGAAAARSAVKRGLGREAVRAATLRAMRAKAVELRRGSASVRDLAGKGESASIAAQRRELARLEAAGKGSTKKAENIRRNVAPAGKRTESRIRNVERRTDVASKRAGKVAGWVAPDKKISRVVNGKTVEVEVPGRVKVKPSRRTVTPIGPRFKQRKLLRFANAEVRGRFGRMAERQAMEGSKRRTVIKDGKPFAERVGTPADELKGTVYSAGFGKRARVKLRTSGTGFKSGSGIPGAKGLRSAVSEVAPGVRKSADVPPLAYEAARVAGRRLRAGDQAARQAGIEMDRLLSREGIVLKGDDGATWAAIYERSGAKSKEPLRILDNGSVVYGPKSKPVVVSEDFVKRHIDVSGARPVLKGADRVAERLAGTVKGVRRSGQEVGDSVKMRASVKDVMAKEGVTEAEAETLLRLGRGYRPLSTINKEVTQATRNVRRAQSAIKRNELSALRTPPRSTAELRAAERRVRKAELKYRKRRAEDRNQRGNTARKRSKALSKERQEYLKYLRTSNKTYRKLEKERKLVNSERRVFRRRLQNREVLSKAERQEFEDLSIRSRELTDKIKKIERDSTAPVTVLRNRRAAIGAMSPERKSLKRRNEAQMELRKARQKVEREKKAARKLVSTDVPKGAKLKIVDSYGKEVSRTRRKGWNDGTVINDYGTVVRAVRKPRSAADRLIDSVAYEQSAIRRRDALRAERASYDEAAFKAAEPEYFASGKRKPDEFAAATYLDDAATKFYPRRPKLDKRAQVRSDREELIPTNRGNLKARVDPRPLDVGNAERAARPNSAEAQSKPLISNDPNTDLPAYAIKMRKVEAYSDAVKILSDSGTSVKFRPGDTLDTVTARYRIPIEGDAVDGRKMYEIATRDGRYDLREVSPKELALFTRNPALRKGQYVVLDNRAVAYFHEARSSVVLNKYAGVRLYDQVSARIRRLAIFTPMYQAINEMGDTWIMFSLVPAYKIPYYKARALPIVRYIQGLESGKGAKALVGEGRKGLGSLGDVTVFENGVERTVKEIADEIIGQGGARQGVLARSIDITDPQVRAATLDSAPRRLYRKTLGKPAGSVNRLAKSREDWSRTATYLYLRDEGFTPTDSASKMLGALIDYGELSKVERNVARRLAFFYTFPARQIPYQTKALLERPGKLAAYEKLRFAAAEAQGVNLDDLRDQPWYVQANVPIPVKIKGELYWVSGNLPFNMLNQSLPLGVNSGLKIIPNDALFAITSLNPIFRAPVEDIANRNFFFRSTITKEYGDNLTPAPSWVVWLANAVPGFADKARLIKKPTKYSNGQDVWLMDNKMAWRFSQVAYGPLRLAAEVGKFRNQRGDTEAQRYGRFFTGIRTDNDKKKLEEARTRLYDKKRKLDQQVSTNKNSNRENTPANVRLKARVKEIRKLIDELNVELGIDPEFGTKKKSGIWGSGESSGSSIWDKGSSTKSSIWGD